MCICLGFLFGICVCIYISLILYVYLSWIALEVTFPISKWQVANPPVYTNLTKPLLRQALMDSLSRHQMQIQIQIQIQIKIKISIGSSLNIKQMSNVKNNQNCSHIEDFRIIYVEFILLKSLLTKRRFCEMESNFEQHE